MPKSVDSQILDEYPHSSKIETMEKANYFMVEQIEIAELHTGNLNLVSLPESGMNVKGFDCFVELANRHAAELSFIQTFSYGTDHRCK